MKRYSKWAIVFAVVLISSSCQRNGDLADAYGHFESSSISVSAERAGTLVEYHVSEGARLEAGQVVGLVDTTMLSIQREQIYAKLDAARAKIPTIQSQAAVIEERIATLDREIERFKNLLRRGAATAKQVDDLESQRRVAVRQLELQTSSRRSVEAEVRAMSTELKTVEDQIRRSFIRNPINGIVLHTYAEQYEMAAPGKALYSIANLDSMDVRVYVTGDQLSSINPGMLVQVHYDVMGGELESVPGTISRISPQAEFTPKFLQTRHERTSMVYAVLIRVGNNGKLNIGMPAEVTFQ